MTSFVTFPFSILELCKNLYFNQEGSFPVESYLGSLLYFAFIAHLILYFLDSMNYTFGTKNANYFREKYNFPPWGLCPQDKQHADQPRRRVFMKDRQCGNVKATRGVFALSFVVAVSRTGNPSQPNRESKTISGPDADWCIHTIGLSHWCKPTRH